MIVMPLLIAISKSRSVLKVVLTPSSGTATTTVFCASPGNRATCALTNTLYDSYKPSPGTVIAEPAYLAMSAGNTGCDDELGATVPPNDA